MGYTPVYPPAQSDTYIKATTIQSAAYLAHFATDPAKSKTGGDSSNNWTSEVGKAIEQRFHIDLGAGKVVKRIYLENWHTSGTNVHYGAKNFTFWGSNNATAFTELDYSIDINWTQLTCSIALWQEHTEVDELDPQYALVTNETAYRYYAMKIADAWNVPTIIGIRHVELQIAEVVRKALFFGSNF